MPSKPFFNISCAFKKTLLGFVFSGGNVEDNLPSIAIAAQKTVSIVAIQ